MGDQTDRPHPRPTVISMFSGMEAASVAAHPLGWKFEAFSEIEPSACQTLHAHYGCGRPVHLPLPSDAPSPKEARARAARIRAVAGLSERTDPDAPVNLGDMTQVDWSVYRDKIDIVVGGPPCQAFSWAGNRQSLDDHRGNLSLAYVRAIHAIRPLWGFTENVPGWLSTKDNAFGCYLGALVGADSPLRAPGGGRWGSAGVVDGPLYRAAWRILDSQGFVPQRRRRVFVVAARFGSGGDPVRVLFETEAEAAGHLGDRSGGGPLFPLAQGMYGNPQASNKTGQESTPTLQERAGVHLIREVKRFFFFGANRCSGETDVASALTAHGGPNGRQDFESEVFVVGPSEALGLVSAGDSLHGHGLAEHTMEASLHAECGNTSTDAQDTDNSWQPDATNLLVRRLTPRECLSLQGFPTDYLDGSVTRGKSLSDGPRYKLCGNSWTVPLVRWVFNRMDNEIALGVQDADGGLTS